MSGGGRPDTKYADITPVTQLHTRCGGWVMRYYATTIANEGANAFANDAFTREKVLAFLDCIV